MTALEVFDEDYDYSIGRGPSADVDVQIEALRDRVKDAPKRWKLLVVIRESAVSDWLLFRGMAQQTWARHKDLPGIDAVVAAGLKPLEDPASCPFPVVTLREGRTKAALFEVEGTAWLYSMASGAKTNSNGDNEITVLLSKLILEHRPQVLDAASFTRLVRNVLHGLALQQVCVRHVDQVRAGDHVLTLRGKEGQWGNIMWTLLTMLSSNERDEIVRRTTVGRLLSYKNKQWVLGKPVCPVGYRFDEQTKNLVVDETQKPLVEGMLRILGGTEPSWRKMEFLSELGLSAPHQAEGGLVSQLVSPHSKQRGLLRWVPLYVEGRWLQRLMNPFPGIDELSGFRVYAADSSKHDDTSGRNGGEFRLRYDWGTPEGGWASPDVIATALARWRLAKANTSGVPKTSTMPLVGYQWTADGAEWRLFAHTWGHYSVRMRPAGSRLPFEMAEGLAALEAIAAKPGGEPLLLTRVPGASQ